MNKKPKSWLIISSLIFTALVGLMIHGIVAHAYYIQLLPIETRCIDEERVELYHIDRAFTVRTEPDHRAPALHTFPAQYVLVLERDGDWTRISTWLGDGWVYVNQPPRRWTYYDVPVISRMVWGEGRGVSRNEQKLIVWTVLNRVDHPTNYHNTIAGVVRARGQFHGYYRNFPVTPEIREMVIEVLEAWDRDEQAKVYEPFSRCSHFLYFHGDGRHNWFRTHHWRGACRAC